MTRKELGRIKHAKVGIAGYQGAQFGVSFELGGNGWGVADFWGAWAPGLIDPGERTQWTEGDRTLQLSSMCARLSKLLQQAKKTDCEALAGVPVEVEFEGATLKAWRILTEVL